MLCTSCQQQPHAPMPSSLSCGYQHGPNPMVHFGAMGVLVRDVWSLNGTKSKCLVPERAAAAIAMGLVGFLVEHIVL